MLLMLLLWLMLLWLLMLMPLLLVPAKLLVPESANDGVLQVVLDDASK